MTDTAARRPRGRPKVVIDEPLLFECVAAAMADREIAERLRISLSTWHRWLRQGDNYQRVAMARSSSAYETWKAIERAAKAGRVGAATLLLRRLEGRRG